MAVKTHPFSVLRRKIRQSAKQFRHNNDNSRSIFHPANGFVHAYEIFKVEAALDQYESTLGSDYEDSTVELNPIEYLRKEAKVLSEVGDTDETRAFAKDVLDYLDQELESLDTNNPGRVFMLRKPPTAQETSEMPDTQEYDD